MQLHESISRKRENNACFFGTGAKEVCRSEIRRWWHKIVVVERTRRAVRQQQGIPASRLLRSFGFFERYVEQAFIDYSQIIEAPKKKQVVRPELPAGFLEKLKQMRYSDHTIRVYTTYFGDFQLHFAGRNLKMISAEDINAYLLYLIEKKHISSCQQNQRINAIKFYYEKVLGQERRCYKVHRAKGRKRCRTCWVKKR